MSGDKQIKEMMQTLNYCCNEYDENGRHIRNKCNSYDCEYWSEDNHCCCSYGRKEAEHLYNAGYRKIYDDNQRQCTCYALGCQMAEQLEKKVAEEIFAEIEKITVKYRHGYEFDLHMYELKKKYTEGGE